MREFVKEKAKYKVESDTKNYCAQYGSTKNASEVLKISDISREN